MLNVRNYLKRLLLVLVAVVICLPASAFAHCDTLDGPVAKAGRASLASGDIGPSLKWVHAEYEPELRAAFGRARKVGRSADAESRALAEQFFLETLVRLHRAGEGAPYTGLKAAGVEPAIAHADAALDSGAVDELANQLAANVAAELRTRFSAARAARAQQESSVAAGRNFVAAYIDYVHYVEAVSQLSRAGTEGSSHAVAGHHD